MSEVDELPALRDELARLQAELLEATAEEAAARAEFDELSDRMVFDEYCTILGSLAPPRQPRTKRPFARLLQGSGDEFDSTEDAPDAFSFMSLMQASTGNEVSLRVLAAKLPHVHALSSHNMEELLQLAPRLPPAGEGRWAVLTAMACRLNREVLKGRWTVTCEILSGVATVYLGAESQNFSSEVLADLVDLLAREGQLRMGTMPAAQQAELAYFVGKHGAGFQSATAYLQSLMQWLGLNSYNEDLYSPRVIWQMIGGLRLGRQQVSPNLASQLTVTAERAITKPLLQKASTDLHLLAIELSEIRARGTGSLWSTLVEKLTHGAPAIFEVPNTLNACISMGYTHDNLVSSNPSALKKHLGKITRPADLVEIARAFYLSGEKNAAVCKILFDRRDLLDVSPECSWAVLAAAAVASEGTAIPEGLLMLRKLENSPDFLEASSVCAERKLIVTLALLPNSPQANALTAASAAEPKSQTVKPAVERLRGLLEMLGLSDAELDAVADGVRVDACFTAHKTVVLVESDALYNVTPKRFQGSGITALKMALLLRRGWKVVLFVSEQHTDDKAALTYLGDTLRKIPHTATVCVSSPEDMKRLPNGQKLKVLKLKDLAMVEVARFLLSVLRGSITIDVLDLSNLGMTDYITEVICEFAVTYMSKYPLARVDLSGNLLTRGFLKRLLHSLKALGAVNRSVEVVVSENKMEEEEAELVDIAPTPVRVVHGPNPGPPDLGLTVYLIGV